MKPIEIKVFCHYRMKQMTVYYYLAEDGSFMFQGCDDYHNCTACKQCRDVTEPKAKEAISSLLPGFITTH